MYVLKQIRRQLSFDSQRGMSLIEVILSASIISIVLFGILSVQLTQNRESRYLSEKLASLEVERLMIGVLTSGNVCKAELTDPAINSLAPYTLNLGDLNANNIEMTRIHSSSNPSSPILIEVGTPASSMNRNLVVSSINVKGFSNTGMPNEYIAEFQISFDSSKLIRPIKNISIRSKIITDTTGKIIDCNNSSSLTCIEVQDTHYTSCSGDENFCNLTARCPVGYKLTSCWNEEDGGSILHIDRAAGTPPQDSCMCIATPPILPGCVTPASCLCWSAIATCCRIL
ncbi:MAG: type II secretion system protein [Bdellovibrionaceae bacterium]|nr:type II secretion system protein [Pseudobdellovibrionaceae bacterium]